MNSFLRKSGIFAIVFVMANLFFSSAAFGQTLTSDQPDYAPGANAILTGSGFAPNEIVKLQVMHADDTPNDGKEHFHWEVTADADGNFETIWHVCEDDCLGSTLKATADGQTSALHAEVIFTDANPTPVSITTLGSTYLQNFNGLESSGTTNTTIPSGWGFIENPGNTTYAAGTGSENAGNTYSFGASGNSERSLGSLQSGSVVPFIGFAFTNNTGVAITSLTVSYTGEQWRIGALGRLDKLDFQYLVSATSLTGGIWNDVNSLDFTAPVTTGTAGLLNGNVSPNRTSITFTITGLNIANGTTVWFRWTDLDAAGADDGLAIDDFSLIANGVAPTAGIYESYAIMNFGGSDVYYDLSAATGLTDFNGVNFGSKNSSEALYLDGAQNKTFKCAAPSNVSAGSLFYRIYLTSNLTPGGFSSAVDLPYLSPDGAATGCGGVNQIWQKADAGVNLLNGLCDGNYTIEVYTTATINTGTAIANNNGLNYKATFTIDNTTRSGINQSFIVLNPKNSGNTFYDLQPTSGNPDFQGSNLGTFCTNETLVIAGGENKDFKCSPNDITGNSLRYRVYTGTPGALAFQTVPISNVLSTVSTGFTCFDQTWQNLSNLTNIIPTTPGTYTLEVYSEAAYTSFNGVGLCPGTHFANNGGTNYKATFTVLAPPSFTTKPAATVSVNTATGLCNATVSYNFVTADSTPITTTYTFSGATTASGSGTGSGSTFNKGTTLVTVTASNACSPNAVYSFNVVVLDVTPPTVVTQNATVDLNASGNATITVGQINNGSTDACGIASVTVSPNTFNCSNILPVMSDLIISEYVEGSSNNKAIEIYNGTNAAISLSNYEIRVYSNGNTSPTAIALTGSVAAGGVFVIANPSANATILAKANQTSTVISYNGDDAVTLTKSGNHLDIIGRIGNDPGVEWTDGGSYSTLDATLRRKITVTAGISVSPTGTGLGAFTTLTSEWNVFTTDDVSGLGTHGNTVTLTVTDNNGNVGTGTAAVIVKDLIAPVITSNGNINVNNNSNICGASVLVSASATDNCTVGTPTGVRSDTLALTAIYPVGTTTITWNVSDSNGNAATAVTQTVTVNDTEAPVVSIPNGSSTIQCFYRVVTMPVPPTATDNCSGIINGELINGGIVDTPTPLTCEGKRVYTFEYADASGNKSYWTYTYNVVVQDFTLPSNGTATVECASAAISSTVIPPVAKSSDCEFSSAIIPIGPVTNKAGTDTYDGIEGTISYTWTYTDCSGRFIHDWTYTYTVKDETDPVLANLPSDQLLVPMDAGVCGAKITFSDPTVTDNCDSSVSVVRTDITGLNSGDLFPAGTTTISYSATDASSNVSTYSFIVTVNADAEAPVVSIPNGSSTIQCFYRVVTTPVPPTATDNCSGTINGVLINGGIVDTPTTLTCEGNRVYTFEYADASGNKSYWTYTYNVVVQDFTLPSNGTATVECASAAIASTVIPPVAKSSDCEFSLAIIPIGPVTNKAGTDTYDGIEGTISYTWTYTDCSGRFNHDWTYTYTVNDTKAPVADATSLASATGQCSASITSAPTATDTCSGTITGTTTDSLTRTTQGTSTVTWTFDDGNGNTSTQTQLIVVTDTQFPTIVCPANIVLSACQPTASWTTPTGSDNCSGFVVTQIAGPASGDTFANGTTTTITYLITDIGGNTATCSFTVERKTALTATATSNNFVLYYGYSGDQTAMVSTSVSGGKAPYTVTATLSRPLNCNIVTTAGDELWVPGSGTVAGSNVNTVCPSTGVGLIPSSTGNVGASGGIYSVVVTLMADAVINFTITDANGCTTVSSQSIKAEDVRCFAGNSTNTKITICHRSGSTKNPCVAICVDYAALQEHLDHGDYVGTCTKTCAAPNTSKQAAVEEEVVELNPFKVTAYPNPTSSQFTLLVEGGHKEKVEVLVYDMLARLVKRIEKTDGQPIQFGEELPRGEYLTVVKQGENMKAVNLIKK